MAMPNGMREGNIYRYKPKSDWCRHGLLRVYDEGRGLFAADTYWGKFSNPECLKTLPPDARFVCNLGDMRATDKAEYSVFSDANRLFIPIGGSGSQYYVRKGAKPDQSLVIQKIKDEIDDNERAIRWATDRLASLRERLAALAPALEPFARRSKDKEFARNVYQGWEHPDWEDGGVKLSDWIAAEKELEEGL